MMPNGEEIVGGTSSLKVCEIQSGKIASVFNSDIKGISSVAVSTHGRLNACGSVDGSV